MILNPWYGFMQVILVLMFVMLLVANNIFNKPALAVFFLLYMFTTVHLFGHLMMWFTRSLSLFVLWLFFVSSYLWSLIPSISAEIILTQTAFIFLAFFVSICQRNAGFYRQLRLSVLIVLPLVLLFSLIFSFASYSSAGLNSFYPHKNSLGAFMALSGLTLFFAPGRRPVHVFFGLLALSLLIASQSKTSIFLFFFCAIFSAIANKLVGNLYSVNSPWSINRVVRVSGFYIICAALVVLVVFRDFFLDFAWSAFSKSFLTGRGTLWLVVIQQIRLTPLLGIGPGVFWQAGNGSEIAKTTLYSMDPYWVQHMISADGSYVDIVASIGVLGLSIFIFTAVDMFRRLFNNWNQSDSRLIFVLAVFVLLQAVTESTILYSTNILWFTYILCYFRVVSYGVSTSIYKIEKYKGQHVINV